MICCRIQSKEAEALLSKAEMSVAEAFEAATAKGVVMYDMPNCSQKPCEIETSSSNGGSTTHAVAASFETAFEVDKEVAAAVKTAFVRLAHCPSFSKDDFKDVLWKITQNPDTGESNELSGFSLEKELDSGSELDVKFQKDGPCSPESKCLKSLNGETTQRIYKSQDSGSFSTPKLVDIMLERIRCLKEDELASLATIVATCGLNAALAEAENNKLHDPDPAADYAAGGLTLNFSRRMSSVGTSSMQYFMDGQMKKKRVKSQLPGLGECLVKHMSKLEREVLEAKNTRKNESNVKSEEIPDKSGEGKSDSDNNVTLSKTIPNLGSIQLEHSGELLEISCKNSDTEKTPSEAVPGLGSVVIKHSSKLEKDIEAEKRKCELISENNDKRFHRIPSAVVISHRKKDIQDIPSLDKFLVKHVSRLEREVQDAKSRRKNYPVEGGNNGTMKYEANIGLHKEGARHTEQGGVLDVPSLDKFLVKHVSRLEREVQEARNKRKTGPTDGDTTVTMKKKANSSGKNVGGKENIDLNKEGEGKFNTEKEECSGELSKQIEVENHKREKMKEMASIADPESLDKVLVKHISRLEKEKMIFTSKEEILEVRRKEAKQKIENAGGLESLDQVLVKHVSKLEREKLSAALEVKNQVKRSASRREAREKELQEAWGGLSLGNSIRPHVSKLEREKVGVVL